MLFSILFLIAIIYICFRISPREKEEHAMVHGAGQIGLMAALALFGVGYFTSYFYATGDMESKPTKEPKLGGAPKETAPGDKEG